MAKRKHSAALFEVYHDNKSVPVRSPRPLSRWFPTRKPAQQQVAQDEPADFDENDPTTMSIRSPLIAPRLAAVDAMEPAVRKAAAPVVRTEVREPASPATDEEPVRHAIASWLPADWAERFHFDRDTREIFMQLPFRIAVITASGVLLCVALAYVLGKHSGEAQVATLTSELADLHRAADNVRPSAIDLPRRTRLGATTPTQRPQPTRVATDDTRNREPETPIVNGIHQDPAAPVDPAPVDSPRIIGLNYLLIQNYPNQAGAEEARDFLISNGVSCTVEKVPAGFFCPDPNWMAVITTRGFDREQLHAQDYTDFKQQLEKLGDKFAGNGKFKRFSLLLYKLK